MGINNTPINNQPCQKYIVPAGRNIKLPTKTTPKENFKIADINNFILAPLTVK